MSEPAPTVTLTIDGRPVTVPRGTTVWHAARRAGIEIPIFCYHDRMPPLGACRMCLVQVEKVPKLATSCTLEAAEGMVVHTTTPEVKAAQEAILEYLLINHPLDCPICDKGGECPLQDQTFRWGPGRSRFIETKRDFAKPVSLGPVLVLDRERCILCWRCVRFGELVAGDDALKGFDRGFRSEINTPFTQPVRSKFIGNTIAICPVGALTAKSYRFAARPWDNHPVDSVCTLCGVGCAVTFDVRGNVIRRTRAGERPEVNDIWLCDLGFFGHGYVQHPERLTEPLVRRDGALQPASWEEALEAVARRIRAAGGAQVALLGGSRMSNEDAYVAARVFRSVVGTPHLDCRLDARRGSPSLGLTWGLTTPISGIADADVVLLVGCDLTEEYPVLWLRLKQALDRGTAVVAVTSKALEVERHLAHHLLHRHGEGSAVLAALRHALDGDRDGASAGGVEPDRITAAATALRGARRPLVMIGRAALEAVDGPEALAEVRAICRRWGVRPSVLRGRGNVFGAMLGGLLPDTAPGGRPLEEVRGELQRLWGAPPAAEGGLTAPEIIEAAAAGRLDVLYVIGGDPATDVPDRSRWTAARARVPFVVVQDAFLTETAQDADVVLPALVLPEKDGTVSSLEGRIQRIRAAVRGPGAARGDWQILAALARVLGATVAYSDWEEIFDEMRAVIPELRLGERAPLAPRRPAEEGNGGTAGARPGPTAPVSASGPSPLDPPFPLTLIVGEVLFDRGAMSARAPAVADLAGEPWAILHPEDARRAAVEDGDPVVVSSPRGALALRARLSTAILPGQAYVPRGFDAAPVNVLVDPGDPVTRVRVAGL
ncbi:MAG: NADH-quinone oxidoreductase subunit NuoG [Armatimonadota bacterium]|nr:NADH-quinone oxidoreductase subunit NuoG [Armatimonadota bacterium]MDR7451863.1 NADH-quinone oxidoreductase subunit NuoG [Armatimonadota bacterium]MDR7467588.1 NADH-quinone oxidoreductase subunit NuoG [Armatimonadota bacterium]MDR7494451.1 NADH-quinone oxidoreductase subunit NuoG [Armatimonadota bacterium]MDR7499712.1 NADH-quinone oxidoreductase subunit NuoG [Armatimonadota bacterium]